MAVLVATRSTCLKRQVGAVVVKDKMVLSTGYNDTARGTTNCGDGGCARCQADKLEQKLSAYAGDCLCIHAEQNAVSQAAYHGVALKGATMYITLEPCLTCAKGTVQSGIVEVVYSNFYPGHDETARRRIIEYLENAGVKVRYCEILG